MSIASDALRNAFEIISQPRDFEVGDLVTWKDISMRNAKYPKDCKDFAIVVRFEQPVRGHDNVGSSQYCDIAEFSGPRPHRS